MSIQTPDRIYALGVFDGRNANIINARGFTGINRRGPGDYRLILEQKLDPRSRIPFVQTREVGGYAGVIRPSERGYKTLRVYLTDRLGQPIDFDFECGVIAFNLEQ